MNNKSYIFFIIFILLVTILVSEIIYLQTSKIDNSYNKQIFVNTIGLPDLALTTEASYIRHRSLSSINQIFQMVQNI